MENKVRIATRESALALWQANHVKALLEAAHPGLTVEINGMTTEGDRNKVTPLSKIGGKGVFVKELEIALMEGTAEIAVHSMKDVPAVLPDGLEIAGICEREDPRDAFVSNNHESLSSLPDGAKVGTSSLRRRLQLQAAYPALVYPELRGNVDTRLRKLDDGDYDAIILATAGLKRLGLENRITEKIETTVSLPAAGQGAVGIECRSDADDIKQLLGAISHEKTSLCVHAERLVSTGLGANCNLPIGAFARIEGETFHINGFVGDGSDAGGHLRSGRSGSLPDAMALAQAVTDDLLSQGAADLIPEE